MSLLDDVSIVVTPNGYKAGELYAVIPVPTEGAELVVNGDFATEYRFGLLEELLLVLVLFYLVVIMIIFSKIYQVQ